MPDPEWTILAEAGRARFLELAEPGKPPRLVEELTDPLASTPSPGRVAADDEMQRFARQVVDRLEQAYAQARFEFLRIAAEPRFLGPLRTEVDKHLDLHRAVVEWRALDVIPLDAVEAVRQMETGGGR
jgi:hypothetical protein